jgi:adenylate kinase
VPTIHIIDLARLVRRVVIENPRNYPYIFAIDKTRKPTQKRIITEVSKGLGTGKIASVEAESVTEAQGWRERLSINLRMKTSDAFKSVPLSAEEAELEEEDKEKLAESKKFPWHSKFGIRKNIRSLETEFNTFRGLNPVKIFISGPPASGKTFYASELAKYYNIPRVHVKQLVAEVMRRAAIEEEAAGEDKLTNDCRTKIEEIKAQMEEAINEVRADQEEPEDGWPEIVIQDSQIRVTNDLLWEVLKLKLGENDCRNRGYILDGYPRSHKDAQNVFLKKVIQFDEDGLPVEEDEEELPEGEEPSFDKHIKDVSIFPGSIVVLEGQDEELISRVRELPEDQIAGTKYNMLDMRRRIKSYRLANNSEVAEPSVQDFFKQQGIKFYSESIKTILKDALNGFKIYIERVSNELVS